MYIGEFAKKAGVDAATLRYYEKEGLLPSPLRSGGGYRLYSEQDLESVGFIQRAKGLGFSLAEIKKIMKARVIKGKACDHVIDLLKRKITELDQKGLEIQRTSRLFKSLLRQWKNRPLERKTCICDDLAQKTNP